MNKTKTVICTICNRDIPKTREFFRRHIKDGRDVYHSACRECEDKYRNMDIWKGDLLLCNKCHEYKSIDHFTPNHTKNKYRKHYSYTCKRCTNVRQAKHEVELDNPSKLHRCLNFRVLGARTRAARSGTEFNITLDYIKQLWSMQEGKCSLSGIPMTYSLREGRIPTNISIDKIDRSKGYTVGNIQLVCMACNQIKSDLTEEEMYNFCKNIVRTYENKNSKNTSEL